MNKKWLSVIMAMTMIMSARSQTLFTYGKEKVDAKEFLRAYNKNNAATQAGSREASIKQYLDLYIASRLKIEEAHNRGYDTLPQVKSEINNLRSQIINNYLADEESITRMVDEAFERSQHDIHVAHIFVALQPLAAGGDNPAWTKISNAYNELKNGADFATVAKKYSDDPSVKENGGDIGFITVFSLPYEFENVIYSTPPGQTSKPFASKRGYHIFRNIEQRPAMGTVKIKQILLAFPPQSSPEDKARIGKRADSLYEALKKGADFGKLAQQFSNDNLSANSGGLVADEIGIGEFDPAFEKVVFALQKNEMAKPLATAYGYHIVQLIDHKSVPSEKSRDFLSLLRSQVERSDRMEVPRKALVKKILAQAGFKKNYTDEKEFQQLSDSLLEFKRMTMPTRFTRESELLTIGSHRVSVQEWINYAQTWRFKPDGSGVKPYDDLMTEFIDFTATNYYKDHLEDFNDEFRYQMNEFKDGNLFFEIMQREIWDKAQTNDAGLRKYFEQHKDRYKWDRSADAVIFFCNDSSVVALLHGQVKRNPRDWRNLSAALSEKVVADSARFEISQIPNGGSKSLKAGTLTDPVHSESDNSSSFAYIVKLYDKPTTRSFEEAKGFVINDYQDELDKEWVAKLRQKYPVEINQKTLAEIIK